MDFQKLQLGGQVFEGIIKTFPEKIGRKTNHFEQILRDHGQMVEND